MTTQVPRDYVKSSVKERLDCVTTGTLSSLRGDQISSRIMFFVCEEELDRFYFLTQSTTPKVEEFRLNPTATLVVLSGAEVLDDFAEITVKGKIRLIDRFEDEAVQRALPWLAKKASMLKEVIASGTLEPYVLLQLDAAEVSFRVYSDIMENTPATIFRFGRDD